MWTIVITLLAFIIIKVLVGAKKDYDKIKYEGGIRHKYSELIDSFLSGHQNAKILQESDMFVSVGVIGIAGSTIYYITQKGSNILIRMEIKNNPLYGNLNMDWMFDENAPQEDMLNCINHDIAKKINQLNSRF